MQPLWKAGPRQAHLRRRQHHVPNMERVESEGILPDAVSVGCAAIPSAPVRKTRKKPRQHQQNRLTVAPHPAVQPLSTTAPSVVMVPIKPSGAKVVVKALLMPTAKATKAAPSRVGHTKSHVLQCVCTSTHTVLYFVVVNYSRDFGPSVGARLIICIGSVCALGCVVGFSHAIWHHPKYR